MDDRRLTIDWAIAASAFEQMFEKTKDLPTQVLMMECIGVLAIFKHQFVAQDPDNIDKFNKFVVDSLDTILMSMTKGQNQSEPEENPIASE